MVCAPKKWEMGELICLLSLLAVRHMRREHIRMMSKNADNEHSLEELSTFHPCFINIFGVIYFCLLFEKMCKSYHRAFLSVKRCFLLPTQAGIYRGNCVGTPRECPSKSRGQSCFSQMSERWGCSGSTTCFYSAPAASATVGG